MNYTLFFSLMVLIVSSVLPYKTRGELVWHMNTKEQVLIALALLDGKTKVCVNNECKETNETNVSVVVKVGEPEPSR